MILPVEFNINSQILNSTLSADNMEMDVVLTQDVASINVEFANDNTTFGSNFNEQSNTLNTEFTDMVVVETEVEVEGGTLDHNELENRDLPNQHPIGSITGLQGALDDKQPKGNYLTEHQSLKGYATEKWVEDKKYLTSHQSLDGYATETWVKAQKYLTQHQSLDGYATEKWVLSKNYLTQHQSLVDYAKKTDIPKSLPASDVYAWAKQPNKPTYTYSEVGADKSGSANTALDSAKKYTDQKIASIPTPDVSGQINTHNTNTSAHNDIRLVIQTLTTKVNDLLDSDDETLDQMSEVVAYIKVNRELLESVTINKVNVADIIDNLETNVGNKPLFLSRDKFYHRARSSDVKIKQGRGGA